MTILLIQILCCIFSGALAEELATTSISMNPDKSLKSVVCVGCTGYADSILYLSDKQGCASLEQSGWCVHTCCSEAVLQALFKHHHSSNSFMSFVTAQLSNKEEVTVIKETTSIAKYIVFADADKSYESGVPSFSVCIVRIANKRKFLTCRDVRCKRGKSKRMENITKLSQVCCHLQLLLKYLRFDCTDNDVHISDESSDSDSGDFKVF